ncbi:MAG: NAD(+) synthase [Gammaproteobacteria bacterium]|nr:NAD(+) synthase [Gammaproteobacteria bacterium]
MDSAVDFAELGFLRAAGVSPKVRIADPLANAREVVGHLEALHQADVSVALFPELGLTGYTAEDLFFDASLLKGALEALALIVEAQVPVVAIVGLPWRSPDGRLFNCAAVVGDGQVAGLVPKTALPNHGEFYERRWFASGRGVDLEVDSGFGALRLCPNQLFRLGGCRFAVELCEDLWSPQPPGAVHSLAGAELVLNLSASNELVSKADYRRDLVRMASGAWVCGYLYAGAGVTESTKDLVFGGHLLAAENGVLLAESERFGLNGAELIVDFDLERLRHDRMQNKTFADSPRPEGHRSTPVVFAPPRLTRLRRAPDPHPFVPKDEAVFNARAREVLAIQSAGLSRRMRGAGAERLVLGTSGGLDSTLALLVCLDALERLGLPTENLNALSLPGPGTSEHTRTTVAQLVAATTISWREISISELVCEQLRQLAHEARNDVVFENVQARQRTQMLFNMANKTGGLLVGTGDLSELALGWCTYNADHMASYNVNAGVPKTLVAYLIRWYASHRADAALAEALQRVHDTPISPELLPPEDGDGGISQRTESIIGPFELHDFFLYHYVRGGAAPEKIAALAGLAFAERYGRPEVKRWLKVFFQRFFGQQFKRTTLPAGPKVGTVSLSPRGDWRMPDEAEAARLIAAIDGLPDNH